MQYAFYSCRRLMRLARFSLVACWHRNPASECELGGNELFFWPDQESRPFVFKHLISGLCPLPGARFHI
jgi:hypothetical protein